MVGELRLVARKVGLVYPGPIEAVRDVQLELCSGELVALLGPNGAGKSSLLKLLAGLLAPTSGTVELEGQSLTRLGHRARARSIAVVPQSLQAMPFVDVETFVRQGRYAHQGLLPRSRREDTEAVRRALEEADAGDLAGRALDQLSGGQRQRVLVARALAQEADVLLFDEPTAALDPEHQVRTFDLIARLGCEGRLAVAVTHDLNLASQFATRLVLLQEGRVVADGGVEEVLARDVLEPVYGSNLRYGRLPAPRGPGERPFVVPWLQAEGGDPPSP